MKLSGSVISEPILKQYGELHKSHPRNWAGKWRDEVMAGVRWREIDNSEDDTRLSTVFDVYRDAVGRILGSLRSGSTLTYPVVFVDSVKCCGNREKWEKNHWRELAGMIGGSSPSLRLSEQSGRQPIGKDHSLSMDKSNWIAPGRAINLWWDFTGSKKINMADFRNSLSVIENAILKYWQLRALDEKLSIASVNLKSLAEVQSILIYGLDEFRKSQFAYGTANDISSFLFDGLSGNELYSHLRERADFYQQMISTRAATLASKRANRFALGALVVAVLLGLPAIRQSLDLLKSAGPALDVSIIDSLSKMSPTGLDATAFYVYLVVLGMMAAIVASGVRWNIAKLFVGERRYVRIGYKWPGRTFKVSLRSPEGGDNFPVKKLGSRACRDSFGFSIGLSVLAKFGSDLLCLFLIF